MSFSNPNVKISYDGNGTDDRFSINFYYLEGDESTIIAELWDYTDSDNPVKLPFVNNIDYVVDASAYPNTEVATAVPVPVDHKIFIYRKSETVQDASFMQGAFPAESIEEMFDKLMMVAQEHEETFTRTLTNEIGGVQISNQDILDAIALVPRVDQNEIDIAQNALDIANNTSAIAGNTASISGLNSSVATNASDIATLQGDVTTLQSDIVSANNDISNLQSDVATAQSDIATLQTQVGSLTPDNVVNITGAVIHNAQNKEIIIIETAGAVDVNLPTPTIGHKIVVKIGANVSNKNIASADPIDGYGLVYNLLSPYESVTLVANGTQWYIL